MALCRLCQPLGGISPRVRDLAPLSGHCPSAALPSQHANMSLLYITHHRCGTALPGRTRVQNTATLSRHRKQGHQHKHIATQVCFGEYAIVCRTVSRPRLYSLPLPFSNADVTMRKRPRSPYGSPCRNR